MITHNRLAYSALAVQCLAPEYAGMGTKVSIWDNASTDDTPVFLKYLEYYRPNEIEVHFSDKNVGLAPVMN